MCSPLGSDKTACSEDDDLHPDAARGLGGFADV